MTKFAKALFLLGSMLFAHSAAAWTRDQAKSLAEDQFKLAFDSLYHHLFSCLTNPVECGMANEEISLLNYIYKDVMFNRQNNEIAFVSEAEQPGFFLLDGAVRIAKTGPAVGSKIFINQDLLAIADATNSFQPMSYPDIVAILVHEFGHHQESRLGRPLTHESLDVLGGKVKNQVLRYARVEIIDPATWSELKTGNYVQLAHYPSQGSHNQNQEFSVLFLIGPFGVVDLSGISAGRLTCPKSYYQDELDFEGTPFQMYLADYATTLETSANDKISFVLSIQNASVSCINHVAGHENQYQTFSRYRDGRLKLPLTSTAAGIVFDQQSIEFSMRTPPDEHWN